MKAKNFKSFIKNNAKKLVLAIMVVIFAVLGSLGLISAKLTPSSGLSTREKNWEGKLLYRAIYSVDFSQGKAKDVSPKSLWINFGSLDYKTTNIGNEIHFRVGFSYSATSTFTEDAFPLENGRVINTFKNLKIGQWQRLASYPTLFTSKPSKIFIVIDTGYAGLINEIAFMGENLSGKPVTIPLTAEGSAFMSAQEDSNAWRETSLETIKTKYSAFVGKNGKSLAQKLIDEQGKFNPNRVDGRNYSNLFGAITEREYYSIEGVKSFLNNDKGYCDKSVGVLGTLILSLGTTIFGCNAFGIRVMPFIFSIATLFVVYALGKILFRKANRALLFVFLFAIGGFSLGLCSVGTADAIAVFFALLSLTFMFKFKKEGIDVNAPVKSFASVIISGASFAFAVATLSRIIFILPALIVPFVYTLISYAKKCRKEEISDYKSNNAISCVVALLSFIVLPFILTGIVVVARFSYFSVHYGTNNLLYLIAKKLFGGIFSVSAQNAGNAYNSFGWLINYGAEIMGNYKAVFGNIVLTVVNICSLIFGLVLILKPLFKKQKLAVAFKSSFVVPFASLALTALFTILGGLIGAVSGISAFYIGQIALSAITVLCVSRLKISNDENSALTKNLVAKRNVARVVLIAMLVVFALAITSLAGFGYFSPIYCFNVLNGGLI